MQYKNLKFGLCLLLNFLFISTDSSNSSGGSEVGLTSLSDALMLPSARLLVEAYNLTNEKIQSTGPKGHILKGDVLKYISFNNITRPEIKQVKQIVQKPVKSKQPVKAEPLRPAPKGKPFFMLFNCPLRAVE